MKKTIAAVTAGLLLVAGQAAAAQGNNAVARVGDRVGAGAEASSELSSVPLPVLIVGLALLAGTIYVATDDLADSD